MCGVPKSRDSPMRLGERYGEIEYRGDLINLYNDGVTVIKYTILVGLSHLKREAFNLVKIRAGSTTVRTEVRLKLPPKYTVRTGWAVRVPGRAETSRPVWSSIVIKPPLATVRAA